MDNKMLYFQDIKSIIIANFNKTDIKNGTFVSNQIRRQFVTAIVRRFEHQKIAMTLMAMANVAKIITRLLPGEDAVSIMIY